MLRVLSIWETSISDLDPINLPMLEKLWINGTNIFEVDLSVLEHFKHLVQNRK